MSNNNELFEQLLTEIIKNMPVKADGSPTTEEDVAIVIGRNKGFLAQVRSRYKKGAMVPKKVIDLLRLHFAMNGKSLATGTYMVPATKTEEIIALKAAVKVLTLELVQLKAKATEKDPALVGLEVENLMQLARQQLQGEP